MDGAALDFMSPTDIYSFFGNALDNGHRVPAALPGRPAEHLGQRLPAERRLCQHRHQKLQRATAGVPNGLPRTSKGDKSLHGFGTKSMHYIIHDLYGGNLLMRQEGDAFIVSRCSLWTPSEGNLNRIFP